jgi:hypothetical protein
MAPQAVEISGTGAAGVDKGRRPAAPRHLGSIDTERGATPIDMRVKIDQPGYDEEPARIDNLTAGEIMPDRGHFAVAKSDVGHLVASTRRVDDPPASENQIRHVPASGKIGRCNKAAIGPFEQAGEGDAGAVAVLRADDLHADRQPFCGETGRGDSRR